MEVQPLSIRAAQFQQTLSLYRRFYTLGGDAQGACFTQTHEQYRGFVLFQRTQAAAAQAVDQDKPEQAIDEILAGLEKIRAFFAAYNLEEQLEDNPMVKQLHKMEQSLRQTHGIEATLQERLQQAVANEEYEVAAELRDALRKRQAAADWDPLAPDSGPGQNV